jgi:hypothetical protein
MSSRHGCVEVVGGNGKAEITDKNGVPVYAALCLIMSGTSRDGQPGNGFQKCCRSVAGLLPKLLPIKLFMDNDVADVADFPTRNAIQCPKPMLVFSTSWQELRQDALRFGGGTRLRLKSAGQWLW